MKRVTGWLGICALGVLMVGGDGILSVRGPSMLPPEARSAQGAVYANIAGQFRTVLANMLWMKADQYHHEFIEHNPHWTQNRDVLPLMKMVTVMDPHFVQAYTNAAWMLGLYQNRPAEARAFLLEGLRWNPSSSEIYETLAILAWRNDHNPRATLRYLERARACARTDFDYRRYSSSIKRLKARGVPDTGDGSSQRMAPSS